VSYWSTFYHFVWGTRHREAIIDSENALVIGRSIQATCDELGAIPHAIGFMPEHIHLAISVPPRIAVSEFVRKLKGKSSHNVNHLLPRTNLESFSWQSEYGVITFSERSLKDVVSYVENQARHHANDDLWSTFEVGDFNELDRDGRSIYRQPSDSSAPMPKSADAQRIDLPFSASKRLRRD
jgi:REP-associated tyrosine transposase